MTKKCTQCGKEKEGAEYYARDNMCKECRKESIKNHRINKKIKEEEENSKKRSFEDVLEDVAGKLNDICISQKDIQIKQRDLEIKLEKIEKNTM